MPGILLCETEYSLEFVSVNPTFLSRSYLLHQDSNSYYLVVATAKIPKIWKRTSLGVFFRHVNLKIVPLMASELFNRNLSTVHPTFFFNFVIAPFTLANHPTNWLQHSNGNIKDKKFQMNVIQWWKLEQTN